MGYTLVFFHSGSDKHVDNVAKKRQSQSMTITPRKKKSKVVMDEMDAVIVRNLEELCQRRSSSATDEDELFGKTVAATLRRLDLRKKAMAKLRIQGVLMDVEFPDPGDS